MQNSITHYITNYAANIDDMSTKLI